MRVLAAIGLLFCLNQVFGQSPNAKLKISHLTGDLLSFIQHSKNLNGNMFPSNSMYLLTVDGVILIDTPWDTTQFQPLLDSIKRRHNQSVLMCIATHFHEDRTAGLEYYRQQGIRIPTTYKIDKLSKAEVKKRAELYYLQLIPFSAIGNAQVSNLLWRARSHAR